MQNRLKKKINFCLSLMIIILLLPLLITIVMQKMKLEQLMTGEGPTVQTSEILSEEMEEQVLSIVANEIDILNDRQVIQAQCVIARTNLYDAKENSTKEPQSISVTKMEEIWGEEFEQNYQKLSECVAATNGEVLVWEDNYIYAAYHAVSSGTTRNMSEWYDKSKMPYLASQECHEDTTAEGYLTVTYLPVKEFLKKCETVFPESTLNEVEELQILERDSADYVLTMKAFDKTCDGEEFRSAFGLNSACFTLTEMEGKVRIVTRGIGHGFGLSQHMAAVLASEGMDYKEILQYFYPGAKLKRIEKSDE